MIPRYSRPDMVAIWSPETRYSIWLEIETLAADAVAHLVEGLARQDDLGGTVGFIVFSIMTPIMQMNSQMGQ